MLAVFIGLFAYTSIIAWALYGKRCTDYVFGRKYTKIYHTVFIILLVIGSILPVDRVWKIADFINALMSIPNLIGIILLSPIVIRISRDSFS